jgi:hypothetical protein
MVTQRHSRLVIPRLWELATVIILLGSCARDGFFTLDDIGPTCVTETDAQLCDEAAVVCGALTTVDACGGARSIACDRCTRPDTCGGAGNPLACGRDAWFGYDSSFAPWSARVVWSSGGGGGISNTAIASSNPHVAVDAGGRIHVVWQEGEVGGIPAPAIHLRVWDGASWNELGTSTSPDGIDPGGTPQFPHVRLDSADLPVVAWKHLSAGVKVARWDGSAWREPGAAGTGEIPMNSCYGELELAIDPLDRIVITCVGLGQVWVTRWDGSAWVSLGTSMTSGISPGGDVSTPSSVAIDAAGEPWVTWVEDTFSAAKVYALRWDGAAWIEMDGSASGGGLAAKHQARIRSSAGGQEMIVGWFTVGSPPFEWTRFRDGAWQPVVSPAPASFSSGTTSFEIAPDGNPTVVWSGGVAHWTGTEYSELSGMTSGGALALGATGNPTVAASGDGEIFVRRWNGGAWGELGSATRTSSGRSANVVWGRVHLPAGAIQPTVMWSETRDYVTWATVIREWNGSAWTSHPGQPTLPEVHDGVFAAGAYLYDSALASARYPLLVTHTGAPAPFGVVATAWNGSAWSDLGGAPLSPIDTAEILSVSVASSAGGEHAVAWWAAQASGDLFHLYVRRWSGAAWEELDGSGSGTGVATSDNYPPAQPGFLWPHAAVALDSQGRVLVTWQEFQSGVRRHVVERWDGAWQELRTSSAAAFDTLLATDSSDAVILARQTDSIPSALLVERWDGASWEALPGPLAGAVGMISTLGAERTHDLALTVDGAQRPVVAWVDSSQGNHEIYLRRWSGSSWESILTSASGGGVSNSAANSIEPALAAAPGLTCVSWLEPGATGASELLLRCSDQ